MTDKRKGLGGAGSDIFFRTDEPIAKPKGGRPKIYAEDERVKVSFWVKRTQWMALTEMKLDEQQRLTKAKKDPKHITITSLVDEALAEFLTRRRRK